MGSSSEPRKIARDPSPLAPLLEGVLANLDLRSRFREQQAVLAWPQIVGKVISSHARAEAVRDGVLLVATDTSAWAQELHLRRHDLLARVSEQLGEGLIREIHFQTGGRRRSRSRASEPAEFRPAEIKLSGDQLAQVEQAAARIEDPALRARAARAFASLARIEQWRRETGWRRCERCGRWQRVGRRWCASCTHSGGRRRRR